MPLEAIVGASAFFVTLVAAGISALVWLIRLESTTKTNVEKLRWLEQKYEEGSRERRADDDKLQNDIADLRAAVARIEGKIDRANGKH